MCLLKITALHLLMEENLRRCEIRKENEAEFKEKCALD
jgi:hypothetical protein